MISLKIKDLFFFNAFCHRDWRDPDYVHVAVYKDRVEIRNPGRLYDGLTLDDLKRGNVSRRRNPLIAEMLRRIHLVEAWGRGMSLILENAPTVTFREVGGLFVASFARPTMLENDAQTSLETALELQNTSLETPNTSLETPNTSLETQLKPAKLQQRNIHETLLHLLHQQPRLRTADLEHATGLSTNGVKYHLNQLKRAGKLRRHGPTKGGYWEVIDQASDPT